MGVRVGSNEQAQRRFEMQLPSCRPGTTGVPIHPNHSSGFSESLCFAWSRRAASVGVRGNDSTDIDVENTLPFSELYKERIHSLHQVASIAGSNPSLTIHARTRFAHPPRAIRRISAEGRACETDREAAAHPVAPDLRRKWWPERFSASLEIKVSPTCGERRARLCLTEN